MRRYVLTGTPGAGKTTILRSLAASGHGIVEEAATAVIARAQARGEHEPWTRASFIDDIVTLQRQRQLEAAAAPDRVQVYDRSPVCTLTLALYLGRPVSQVLAAELERIASEGIYQRKVFFVRNLGLCEPTPARRIGFEESLAFEEIHEQTYRAHGFELVDIPAGDLGHRVAAINSAISAPG